MRDAGSVAMSGADEYAGLILDGFTSADAARAMLERPARPCEACGHRYRNPCDNDPARRDQCGNYAYMTSHGSMGRIDPATQLPVLAPGSEPLPPPSGAAPPSAMDILAQARRLARVPEIDDAAAKLARLNALVKK